MKPGHPYAWWFTVVVGLSLASTGAAQKLPVIITSQADAKDSGVALTVDGQPNALPVYVRPNKPHLLYILVKNDNDADENIKIELVNADGAKLATSEGVAKANSVTRIANFKSEAAAPAPAPMAPVAPGTPAPAPVKQGAPFTGDLKVIVRAVNGDEEKFKETYRFPIRVADPSSYISIESSFIKDTLSMSIKRTGKFAEFVTEKEPCDISISISPDRVEGLVNAGDGDTNRRLTFKDTSAELKIKNIKVKDVRPGQRSQILVTIDDVPRAFVINQPLLPTDTLVGGERATQPEITVYAPRYADSTKPLTLRLELDNLSESQKAIIAKAEIYRGRYADSNQTPTDFELVKSFTLNDKKLVVGVTPEGVLQFNNQYGSIEYKIPDVKNLAGTYQFKPSLTSIDSQNIDLRDFSPRHADTTFDATAPDAADFLKPPTPKEAKRGDKIVLRAKALDKESGIKGANFFVLSGEGQKNVNIAPKEGKLVAGTKDTYEWSLEIEPAVKDSVWYGVEFVNNVDMVSKLVSHGIRIVEAPPPGKEAEVAAITLKGKAVDGAGRAQPKLNVGLYDVSADKPKEVATTKTGVKPAGLFAFEDVKPGKYKIYIESVDAVGNKIVGEQTVEIKGKDVKVGGKPLKEKDIIIVKVS